MNKLNSKFGAVPLFPSVRIAFLRSTTAVAAARACSDLRCTCIGLPFFGRERKTFDCIHCFLRVHTEVPAFRSPIGSDTVFLNFRFHFHAILRSRFHSDFRFFTFSIFPFFHVCFQFVMNLNRFEIRI